LHFLRENGQPDRLKAWAVQPKAVNFDRLCAASGKLLNPIKPAKAVHKIAKDNPPASRTAVRVAEKEKSSISSPKSFPEEFRAIKSVRKQIPQLAKNRYYLFVHYLLYSSFTLDFTAWLLFENS
jgi:hypothetical protein